MKLEHWAMIAGVVILAIVLYANACPTCDAKAAAMTGYGVWPGAGPGVANPRGYGPNG